MWRRPGYRVESGDRLPQRHAGCTRLTGSNPGRATAHVGMLQLGASAIQRGEAAFDSCIACNKVIQELQIDKRHENQGPAKCPFASEVVGGCCGVSRTPEEGH